MCETKPGIRAAPLTPLHFVEALIIHSPTHLRENREKEKRRARKNSQPASHPDIIISTNHYFRFLFIILHRIKNVSELHIYVIIQCDQEKYHVYMDYGTENSHRVPNVLENYNYSSVIL